MGTQLSFAVLFYTAPKSNILLGSDKCSCFYIIILDSCMSIVYFDSNYNKEVVALMVVMMAFCSEGCFPRGRIILSLCRNIEVVSDIFCSWGMEDFRGYPPSWHCSPMLCKSGWSWACLYLCVFAILSFTTFLRNLNTQRKHQPLETNEKDHLCCVSHRNIFFFSCWTKFFPEQCQALKLLSLLNFQSS